MKVKFEQFARCNYCWAPQALCNKWTEDDYTQGGYRSLGAKNVFQFDRVLQQAVAALLTFHGALCRPWLGAQMQREKVIDGSAETRLRQWLAQKVQIGQRNASGMCCLLYA
ncbi:hypothetical protein T440DRAFT_410187 [Plenodomus tracheiphilus IPT5]|uniref:Uncharacterized protein n=1 Tax=Plenodomus tracheiphilus IPT5 TaxID=1408161 RepID=A0A6A7AN08_9PLEO|nr:hypothetical protein T440DRAFT_410187 [Plenodomus tracheiphilus IPT5]